MTIDEKYYKVLSIMRNNIRKYRKLKNLTQEKLAEETGLSVDYIQEIESDSRNKSYSIKTLVKISNVLDVRLADFFKE